MGIRLSWLTGSSEWYKISLAQRRKIIQRLLSEARNEKTKQDERSRAN